MKMLSIRNIQCQFLFGVKPRLAILWDLLQQFQVLLCICMSMWEKEVVVLVQFMLNSTRLSCKCLLTVSLILFTFWITCRIVVISVPTSQSIVPFPQNLSMCSHRHCWSKKQISGKHMCLLMNRQHSASIKDSGISVPISYSPQKFYSESFCS